MVIVVITPASTQERVTSRTDSYVTMMQRIGSEECPREQHAEGIGRRSYCI